MSDSGSMNLDLGVNLGVTLDGAGLQGLSNTIKEISKGKDLQRYWKDVESATDSAAKAIERYNKNVNSKGLAENLLKQINALKALTKKENLSELFPNMELNLDELVESAKKIVPQISSQFSVDSFSQAFKTFDLLKEKSIDLSEAFRMLSKYAELVDDNFGLRKENSQFRELIGDSDVEEVKSKLLEIKRLRDQAEEIFTSFLKVNNVERTDYWGDEKFSDYFDAIRKGSLTATEAISRFKTEYAYLLEDGFKSNNDTFGLEQLQAFSNKLDSIFRQVEETSTKINDIISNGVITKSVENLSMDSSLSDSQRSLFGNLLQDEESLKSITALFQKLIEESNKTSKVDLFNDEQLQQVLSIFDKMEGHLSSLRSIISDVGDGEEFSPLLKMINNVQSSISELATSVKGIGLNMNIDVGSDDELDRKLQTKVANALQAYQKLFNNIKMTSAGGSLINQDFFDFNLDNYDTAYQKLQAIVNFIKKQRVEAKKQFNGYDALYEDSDKSLWKSAQAYLAQVTKAETEIKKANSGESNPLENLFGNTKDLSEVIEQLNKVVEKLNEISSSATEFKNIFKEGFNVTASVEEIDKLTNRVKELEDELSKIKLNPVNVDKSNISSDNSIRNVLPSDSEFKNVIENLDLTKSKLGEIVKIIRQAHADKDGKFYESFTLTDRNGSTETYGESSKTSKGQLLNYKYIEASTKAVEQESKALNQAWEEANKVNNALNETKNTLSSLPRMTELDTQFSSLDAKLSSLNSELTSGKISVADYKKEVKSLTAEYSKLVTIQQNRDVETYKQNAKAAEQEAKAVKEVWDKNVKAIQDYMDAVTKLNNLNAKDKGSGKYASQIALQEKNVEELKEKALEARTAITSMINPHDVPLNTWRDYLDVMKKFDQASLGSAESVAKLEDALRKMDFSSLESASTKFESQFKNLSIKPDGDHQFLSWTNDLKELNAKIDEYNSKVKYLKENNIVDGEQVDEVKNLRDEIEQTINVMTKTPQAKRGWTDIGVSKAAEKVANVLKQNTKMSKEARDAIRAYYNELRSGNPSQSIDEILVKVNQLVQKERELGRVGKSFGEIFKEKVIYGGAAQLAGMVGFYDVINVGREGFQTIRELDTALTEMKKVSDETTQSLKNYQSTTFDVGDAVGATAKTIQNSTADWMRLGRLQQKL